MLLSKMLPLIHNPKYSRTSIYLLQILVDQHQEPSEWKQQILDHIDNELENINIMTKLDGVLELIEHNFE